MMPSRESQTLSLLEVGPWEQAVKNGHESMVKGRGDNLGVDGQVGIGKGEFGTSMETGQPRKGASWSQGRR